MCGQMRPLCGEVLTEVVLCPRSRRKLQTFDRHIMSWSIVSMGEGRLLQMHCFLCCNSLLLIVCSAVFEVPPHQYRSAVIGVSGRFQIGCSTELRHNSQT